MLYKITEKQFCFGNDFNIHDSRGRLCFYVDGKAFSLGNQLSFQDARGKELAFIRQKLLSFGPKYEIYIDGELFAEFVKEFTWFDKQFTLDVPGPNDYTIDGSFWNHDYVFRRSGHKVATVSKTRWSWTDSYGVSISDREDKVAILCSCIIIDQILYDRND
ncbi:MAG: LURP-one-related family protein [Planctomycetes bacterium]|nr:LURP-one-related family protein [Planctomycetota bacterium]